MLGLFDLPCRPVPDAAAADDDAPVNGDGRDGEGGDDDEDSLENNGVGRRDLDGGRRIIALAL